MDDEFFKGHECATLIHKDNQQAEKARYRAAIAAVLPFLLKNHGASAKISVCVDI
ncbi:MAG: hypothetical protein AAFP20_03980 [Cyanobacteria bacterium J06614_10]